MSEIAKLTSLLLDELQELSYLDDTVLCYHCDEGVALDYRVPTRKGMEPARKTCPDCSGATRVPNPDKAILVKLCELLRRY